MEPFLVLAERNRKKAAEIVARTGLVGIWESVGAEVRPVGSFRMGLLCKHRDIDFHIYSSPLNVSDSFRAMAKLAENGAVEHIEYANLLHTEERCLEWHVRYRDEDGEDWQIDMIHIVGGSRYDGYFERMADCISETLTEETRRTILRLKYETPDTEKFIVVFIGRSFRTGCGPMPNCRHGGGRIRFRTFGSGCLGSFVTFVPLCSLGA